MIERNVGSAARAAVRTIGVNEGAADLAVASLARVGEPDAGLLAGRT
jgi:hypothetical protein